MKEAKHAKTISFICLLSFGIILALLPTYEAITWEGGFLQVAYQLQFLDKNNMPLKNVELHVYDEKGQPSFCYPVTDYHSEHKPVSNEKGILTFHHVSFGVEFSWQTRSIGLVIPLGGSRPPVYYCHFVLHGRQLLKTSFNELDKEVTESIDSSKSWEELSTIEHRIKFPKVWPETLPDHLIYSKDKTKPIRFIPYIKKIKISIVPVQGE